MPDSVGMKANLGMIAECWSFISVIVTSPLAKTNKQLRESFIWLTIPSHSLSLQRSQDRPQRAGHIACTVRSGEKGTYLCLLLSASFGLVYLVQGPLPNKQWAHYGRGQ